MIRLYFLLILALCHTAFSERLVLRMATGGRGMIGATSFLFPPFVLLALVFPFWPELRRLLRFRPFLGYWMPFLALSFLLPFAGVLLTGAPGRSIFASWMALIPMGYVALGAAGQFSLEGAGKLLGRFFLFAVLAHLGLAILQTLGQFRQMPGILQTIYDWDFQFKFTFQQDNIILARATGLYLNPNSLGVWSILALWISFFMLEGKQRVIGTLGAFGTLVLCQSRGSLLAFFVSASVLGISWILAHSDRAQRRKVTLAVAAGLGLVTFILIPGMADSALVRLRGVPGVGGILERYTSGAKVVSQGVQADTSFSGRTELWKASLDYLADHPFGTLTSPGLATNLPQDSQFVSSLEQGSFYLLGALLLVLLGGARLVGRTEPEARALAAASLGMMVNGISAVPFSVAASDPFWLLVGVYVAKQIHDRDRERLKRGEP